MTALGREARSWDGVAGSALLEVFDLGDPAPCEFKDLVALMDAFIDDNIVGVFRVPVREQWRAVGKAALGVAAQMGDEDLGYEECWQVLKKKHRDYGPHNIWRFSRPGQPGGLLVRCWDKVARVENLLGRGVEPENESLRDSFLDLVNYAAIGMMVEDDTFLTPVAD